MIMKEKDGTDLFDVAIDEGDDPSFILEKVVEFVDEMVIPNEEVIERVNRGGLSKLVRLVG